MGIVSLQQLGKYTSFLEQTVLRSPDGHMARYTPPVDCLEQTPDGDSEPAAQCLFQHEAGLFV